MTLRDVRQFQVQASSVWETEEAIREAGVSGHEMFVLWSGTQRDGTFTIESVHIPRQSSYKLQSGLCVRVDGSELHRLNVWLYEAGQVIAVQIHSHPGDAYHSETDDTYPIATLDGSLSIVLPLFGREGFASKDIAAYRLEQGAWFEIANPVGGLVEVVRDGLG